MCTSRKAIVTWQPRQEVWGGIMWREKNVYSLQKKHVHLFTLVHMQDVMYAIAQSRNPVLMHTEVAHFACYIVAKNK